MLVTQDLGVPVTPDLGVPVTPDLGVPVTPDLDVSANSNCRYARVGSIQTIYLIQAMPPAHIDMTCRHTFL